MKFVDSSGSHWQVVRHIAPWTARFRVKGPLAEGSSPFDGSNNLAGIVLFLAMTLLLSVPLLIELLLQLILFPFFLAFRYLGWVNTSVAVRCTAKVVGQSTDGSKEYATSGALENWRFSVTGFVKAGKFRDAVADFIKYQGRSADVDHFASEWLNDQLSTR